MTIAELLSEVSHAQFVGRERELEVFRGLLQSTTFRVLQITGDAGSGKSSLVRECMGLCRALDVPGHLLDVSHLSEVTPATLRVAMAPFFRGPDSTALRVLFVDAYDDLSAHEAWFLEQLVPELPPATLLVLTSRNAFGARWSNLGWSSIVTRMPLDPLSKEESAAFLARRAIDASKQSAIARFAAGSPLLLALSADVAENVPECRFGPFEEERVLKLVLELLHADVVDKRRREVLGLCSVARFTTFELLEELVDGEAEVGELFAWLRSLSFVEDSPLGLRPHRVIRHALVDELKRHQPSTYLGFHRRLRSYYRKHAKSGADQARWVADRVFLDRELPELSPYFDWTSEEALPALEPARPSQFPQIVKLVARFEGEESAAWAEAWLNASPESFEVCADAAGNVRGFLTTLRLGKQLRHEIESADPVVSLARSFIEKAGFGPGESALFFRFWMTSTSHRDPSPVLNAVLTSMMKQLLARPKLAFHFTLDVKSGFWTALARAQGIKLRSLGTLVQGGIEQTATVCRWRDGSVSSVFERPPQARIEPKLPTDPPTSTPIDVMLARPLLDEAEAQSSTPATVTRLERESEKPFARALQRRLGEVAAEASLSQREQEVLELALVGRDANQIGDVLGIKPRTAKFHLSNVFVKLGADSRADLLRVLL